MAGRDQTFSPALHFIQLQKGKFGKLKLILLESKLAQTLIYFDQTKFKSEKLNLNAVKFDII